MIKYNADQLKVRADACLVGGVSCGWNSMEKIGAIHFTKAEGCHLYRVDGKRFIDFSMGWGSLFLGHNHLTAKKSFEQSFEFGFGMQYETEYHVLLAELICQNVPCAEKVRLTNTGTESTMYAIRMARAYTGKEKIVKFEGHFHGVHDYLNFSNDVSPVLGKRFNNGAIESLPGSSGIPRIMSEYIITVAYNDFDSFSQIMQVHKDEIAGVVLEPICLASAIMFPGSDFLNNLRKICCDNNILLIFDEVMSGFRENIGCAQKSFNVIPDIATFSKILGGGFVISAIAGKEEFMNILDPIGNCVASGTNNGRLASVISSYNTLSHLCEHPEIYEAHRIMSEYFISSVKDIFSNYGVKGTAKGYGGRTVIYFGSDYLEDNYEYIVKHWDKEYNLRCYQEAYRRGLYGFLMPLRICPEPVCLTPAHSKEDVDETLNILEDIVKNVK